MNIVTLSIPQITCIEQNFDLKDALEKHLNFIKYEYILNGWESYELPEGKHFIYIYHEYDLDDESYEVEIGFLVLEDGENPTDLKQFCIDHMERIIEPYPEDR